MYCFKCGAYIEEGLLFCTQCGFPSSKGEIKREIETSEKTYCTKHNNNMHIGKTNNIKEKENSVRSAIAAGKVQTAMLIVCGVLLVVIIVLLGKIATREKNEAEENAYSTQEAIVTPGTPYKSDAEDVYKEENRREQQYFPAETTATDNSEIFYVDDFEMMILEGRTRYYDESELWAFSRDEVALLRNGQYALSGLIFKKAENKEYFNNKGWYFPESADPESVYSRMNDYQRKNIELCVAYEEQMGWR